MAMLRAAAPRCFTAMGSAVRVARPAAASCAAAARRSTAPAPVVAAWDVFPAAAIPAPCASGFAALARVGGDTPVLAAWATTPLFEAKINTRKPRRANKGARPCSRVGRRKRYRDVQKGK